MISLNYKEYVDKCNRAGIKPIDEKKRNKYILQNAMHYKNHLKRVDRQAIAKQSAELKVCNPSRSWVNIHSEYMSWRKTEDFKKWKKKQFLRQGGTCYYCDGWLPALRINVEHIIPKSKGGTNDKKNLVLSCSTCNKNKNTEILDDNKKAEYKRHNKKKRGTYLQNKEARYYNPVDNELSWLRYE